jgi:hypothetical protein
MARYDLNYGLELERKIIKILREYPQGLTIKEISRLTKLCEATINTKVIKLKYEGWLTIRYVGATKLIIYKKNPGRRGIVKA